jgi:hypothetical protein
MTDPHAAGHPRPVLLDALAAEVTGLFGAFGFDVSEDTVRAELLTFAATVNDPAGTDPRAYPYPYPNPAPTGTLATDRGYGLAAFSYDIQTQAADGGWVVAHTGTTDPYHFQPTQTALDSIARTLFGNAGYVLGLHPTDPMPAIRVHTWYAQCGPVGVAETPDRQELLEAALYGDLIRDIHTTAWITNAGAVRAAMADGLIDKLAVGDGKVEFRLTETGEKELARLWGPDRVPPGKGGYLDCHEHGVYEAGPGDWWACPRCPTRAA